MPTKSLAVWMPLELRFSRDAELDPRTISLRSAKQADGEVTRSNPLTVRAWCQRIDNPGRGAPRPELGSGLGSVGFEKRLLVIYRIGTDAVVVRRTTHGPHDLASAIRRRRV